jgi:hypothetical protein
MMYHTLMMHNWLLNVSLMHHSFSPFSP